MKPGLADAQIIEFFHLAFLQVLQARLDQARYVLKGGANLRYFFESLRYSQDIDLDAVAIEPWKLEAKIDEVLDAPAMGLLLRSGGLAIRSVTKPKQTDTTQRWKPVIEVGGRSAPVHTKVEFSHRRADPRRILEAVPNLIVAPYAMRAPTILHYTSEAAIEQKIAALALRSETQARDVFDLELLLRQHQDNFGGTEIQREILEAALTRILDMPFGAFRDQVQPFLEPEISELYDDPATWERMRDFVAEQLSDHL